MLNILCIIALGVLILGGWGFAVYDIRKREVPIAPLCLYLAYSALVVVLKACAAGTRNAVKISLEAVLAGVVAAFFFFLCALVTKGLGGGDVKFMAVLGLTLGFSGLTITLLGTAIATAIYAIAIFIKTKIQKIERPLQVAYIPFLMIGATPAYIIQILGYIH